MTFRVYERGEWPKKKKNFFDGTFTNRQKARVFCRNRWASSLGELVIVHPDGTKEPYKRPSF